MTEQEVKQQRARAVQNALASSALEGLLPSKTLQAGLKHYKEGGSSLEQLLQDAQARHARR